MQRGVSIDDKCVAGSWQYSSGCGPSSLWSQNSLNELMEAFWRSLYWNRCTINYPTHSGWLIYKLTDRLCVWTKRSVCVHCCVLYVLCGGTETYLTYTVSQERHVRSRRGSTLKHIYKPTLTHTQTHTRWTHKHFCKQTHIFHWTCCWRPTGGHRRSTGEIHTRVRDAVLWAKFSEWDIPQKLTPPSNIH